MKKTAVKIAAVVMLALAMCVNVFAVSAIEEKDASLTVTLASSGSALSGVTVSIYKVAETDEFAYPTKLAEGFEDCNVELQPENSSTHWTAQDWLEKASTLNMYILANSIDPLKTETTDSEGKAEFTELERGFYLVTVSSYTSGTTRYTVSPYLVSVPSYNSDTDEWDYDSENIWDYAVISSPKVQQTEIPSGGNTPSGGDEPATVTREVLKIWREDDEETRPESVTVQLYRNGTAYGSAVTLSSDNNWRYTWTGLSASSEWQIAEIDVPENYTATVDQTGITFTLTNTADTDIPDDDVPQGPGTTDTDTPPGDTTDTPGDTTDTSTDTPNNPDTPNPNLPEVDITDEDTPLGPGDPETSNGETPETETPEGSTPDGDSSDEIDIPEDDVPKDAGLPQTGQLWWPVPVLGIGGVVFIIAGVLIKKKNDA